MDITFQRLADGRGKFAANRSDASHPSYLSALIVRRADRLWDLAFYASRIAPPVHTSTHPTAALAEDIATKVLTRSETTTVPGEGGKPRPVAVAERVARLVEEVTR